MPPIGRGLRLTIVLTISTVLLGAVAVLSLVAIANPFAGRRNFDLHDDQGIKRGELEVFLGRDWFPFELNQSTLHFWVYEKGNYRLRIDSGPLSPLAEVEELSISAFWPFDNDAQICSPGYLILVVKNGRFVRAMKGEFGVYQWRLVSR